MKLRTYFKLLAEDQPIACRGAKIWKPILKVASILFGVAVVLRRLFYQIQLCRSKKLNIPVVSIGNITWGGTGKTSLVDYVARFYIDRKITPLVLSRGYGEDESKELMDKLPEATFGIGKNRYQEAIKALKNRTAQVALMDDGFQHLALKRDLDIVVINVLDPFGNGSLIPRGVLREPLTSLKRASLIVLNDVNLKSRKEIDLLKENIKKVVPNVQFIEAFHEPLYFYRPQTRARIPVERLQGKRVTIFSGVGMPRSFQMLLNQMGMRTVRNFEFCDHHCFSEPELVEILETSKLSESDEVITTEKDFFRCRDMMVKILNPVILKVRLRVFAGEAILQERLERVVGSLKTIET